MTIFDEILLRRDGVDSQQWPILNCSQANELSLEDSDLRVDADRKILFYDANSSSTPLQITGDGRIIGSLACQSDLSVSGNLGVGTTTPTEKLDVAGKIKATDLEASGTLDANTLQITGNGNLAGSLTIQSDLSVSGNLGIGTTTSTEKLDVAGKIKATNLEVSGTVQADTLQIAGNSNLGGSLTCQSDLSVSGNLGIGTTTPTEKLDVAGKIKAIDLDVNGAIATEQLSVSGNVGIGTKDLKTPLHLYSRNNPAILRIQSSDAFGAGQIEFWSDPQGATNEWRPGFIKSTDQGGFTGGLAFFVNGSGFERRTSAVEVMRIENGQVGIGTTTPSERLEVNGTIKATAYEGDGSGLTGIIKTQLVRAGTAKFRELGGRFNTNQGVEREIRIDVPQDELTDPRFYLASVTPKSNSTAIEWVWCVRIDGEGDRKYYLKVDNLTNKSFEIAYEIYRLSF